MRILYLGPPQGTSIQRVRAMERLGHDVTVITPDALVPRGKLKRKFHWETGGVFLQKHVENGVLGQIRQLGPDVKFDLTWVDHGRYVSGSLVDKLKGLYGPIVNYNIDDPFGPRDRFSWTVYRRSVPHYDLVVLMRQLNVAEAKRRGAKDLIVIKMAADEIAHRPRELTTEDHAKWDSDVLFVGTWFPERGPFMSALMDQGVPLSIYGDRWQRAPEWSRIQSAWKGPALQDPEEYARAIQCSKISLGLLSKGNRDLHTTRSSEIPSIGSLFCGERTSEHEEMYVDSEEAVFWNDAAECAEVCKKMLGDDTLRERIRAAGFERVRKNASFNEPLVRAAIERVMSSR